jgi:hypothetical protein
MEKSNITSKNFRDFVISILEEQKDNYKGSLEEYLRSLWIVVNEHKDDELNIAQVAFMIENAFNTEPSQFDSQWLSYEKPLNWNRRNNSYVIESFENSQIKIIASNVDDFDILKHTILFQIADLYRMRDNQLKNEGRYFGIDYPTGNRWYNFDVFTYLECGTRGMGDHNINTIESTKCDWAGLAGILELGRLYE